MIHNPKVKTKMFDDPEIGMVFEDDVIWIYYRDGKRYKTTVQLLEQKLKEHKDKIK